MNQLKTPSTVSIMDLGKMLLVCAKDGDTTKVHELMSRGAPFTTDWVNIEIRIILSVDEQNVTCDLVLLIYSLAHHHCIWPQ